MKKIKQIFFISLLFIWVLEACQPKKTRSEEEYILFINDLITELYNENPAAINNIFDYAGFAEAIIKKGNIPARYESEIISYLQTNFKPGNILVQCVAGGGHIYPIMFYKKNDTPHVSIRIYHNGNIIIEDWILEEKEEKIFIKDAFLLLSGIYWSDEWEQNICNRFNIVTNKTYLINQLIEVNYLIAQEKYLEADSLFFFVEPNMSDNLYAQTAKLRLISIHQSYDSMFVAVHQFIENFPENQNTAFFYLLQSSIRNGLTDTTKKYCDLLMEQIGYDPIYFVYQSWSYQQNEQLEQAKQYLDSVITYIPVVYNFHQEKLGICYQTKNYDEFVEQLYIIDSFFEPSGEYVSYIENQFPEIKSFPKFREWREKTLALL